MTTNDANQPTLNTTENITNPATSTSPSTHQDPINITNENPSPHNNPPAFENPTTGTQPAANTTGSALSSTPPLPATVAASDVSHEPANVPLPPTTTHSAHQVHDTSSPPTSSSTSNRHVTQTEPPSHDIPPEIFPPTPTHSLDDQAKFNSAARGVFTTPTDDRTDKDDSAGDTSQSLPLSTPDTNKAKKSPAPVAKSSFVDVAKTPSPSNTAVNINELASVTPTLVEQQGSSGEKTSIEPPLVSPAPPAISAKKSSLAAKLRPSVTSILIFALILLAPIVELIIGWRYADDCPIHWRIPHYLVVSGVVVIVAVSLVVIIYLLKRVGGPSADSRSLMVNRVILLLAVTVFLLVLFLIGWFIAGCIWVFRVFNKVQFSKPSRTDYCHPILYRFAYWLLLLTIICVLYILFNTWRQIRKALAFVSTGGRTPVPTSEVQV